MAFTFFSNLFWPQPRLLATPDFGQSDAWANFSEKFLLWEKLHKHTLPLWTPLLGAGFPLLGNGTIGMFYLPNLILFYLFSPIIAYNSGLVLASIIFGSGTYIWLRLIHFSLISSLFAGLSMTLSAMMITQSVHMSAVQGFSMLPLVLASTLFLTQKKSKLSIAAFAFIASQQFFTGFPQASFISLLFASLYYFWLLKSRNNKLQYLFLYIVCLLFTIGISAIQLVPSIEFSKSISSSGGYSGAAASFYSFPFKHLLTFLNPFLLGNPKIATYPDFIKNDGSIFWENSGYIGIIAIFLILILPVFYKRLPNFLKEQCLFFVFSLIVSFFLMLGKYSPFYFIYSFWPFTLFRVPSRFIWVFSLNLALLSACSLEYLWQKTRNRGLRILFVLIVISNSVILLSTWKDYHLLVSASTWLAKPPVAENIPGNDRIYTIGGLSAHNRIFSSLGWQDAAPYFYMRNTITSDKSIVWHIQNYNIISAGRFLTRSAYIDSQLANNIEENDSMATISSKAQKILNLLAIQTIVSNKRLVAPSVLPKFTISQGTDTYSIYNNPQASPRVYLANKIHTAETIEEALRILQSDSFIAGQSVLLEQQDMMQDTLSSSDSALIVNEDDVNVTIRVSSQNPQSVLVLADTYYPGWNATIDGVSTEILPANISQRAVIVPEGNHTVQFIYRPKSLIIGAWITTITFFGIILLLVLPAFFEAARKIKIVGRFNSFRKLTDNFSNRSHIF